MNVSHPESTPAEPAQASPPRRTRLGIMGGTFDPIHHGHLVAASEVASLFALDEVVFVPTGQPWQKDRPQVSEPEDRYLMTVIATASNPSFSVSRVDIDRGGPTYTVDTLRDLRLLRGENTDFFFITGADALGQIFSWRDADEMFEMAHFVGCTRPGHDLADPGLPHGKASLVEIPALAISSTACRDRVRRGEPVWYLVPDGIVQYINKRGLYHDPTALGAHLGEPHPWEEPGVAAARGDTSGTTTSGTTTSGTTALSSPALSSTTLGSTTDVTAPGVTAAQVSAAESAAKEGS